MCIRDRRCALLLLLSSRLGWRDSAPDEVRPTLAKARVCVHVRVRWRVRAYVRECGGERCGVRCAVCGVRCAVCGV
eukprot:13704946-Alexandrium_andersonii.AAC.1